MPDNRTDREACGITSAQHGACWLPPDHPGDHEAMMTANRWPRVDRDQARQEGLVEAARASVPSIDPAVRAFLEKLAGEHSLAFAHERDEAKYTARAILRGDLSAVPSRTITSDEASADVLWKDPSIKTVVLTPEDAAVPSIEGLREAAEEVLECQHDYPTDLSVSPGWRRAFDRLAAALVAAPEPEGEGQ